MRRSIYNIVFIALAFSAVISCASDDRIWMVYEETQCADAWVSVDDNSTENKVLIYLDGKGILVYQIEIVNYSQGPFCLACTCPSGNNIRVLIDPNDREVLLEEGFSE